MKKAGKKLSTGPSQVSSFKAGVLYFANKEENQFPVLESLLNSNRGYQVLVINAGDQETLKRWQEQGKLSCIPSSDMVSSIQNSEAEYWLGADASTSWNIQKSIHSIQVDGETSLYLPESHKIDAGKPTIGTQFSRLYYSKLQAFFSPSTLRDSVWKAFLIEKSRLLELIQFGQYNTLLSLYHRICVADIDYTGFDLVAHEYPNYIQEGNKTAKAGIGFYARWFFSDAIKTAKNQGAEFKTRLHALSRFLFASFFFLCLFAMPLLSFDYGISWDEKLQYEYAHDIYAYLTSFGEDETIFDFKNKSALWQPMQYYGSFFDLLTVAIVDVFGIENEFELRHFLNALFGVFGLLFAGLIARAITKNWFTAFLTFLFLLLTPSYFGHSMFNPKDIPFATGFFMAMYYMIHFIRELPSPRFSTILMMILGIALSISIRVGGILIYPYILLFAGVKWLGVWKNQGSGTAFAQFSKYILYFIPVLVFGYLLGLVFWPYALQDPIANPLAALKGLSNVNYTTSYETFEGVRTYMSKVPWYYSLKLMMFGSALIVLVGGIIQLLRIPFTFKKMGGWNLMLIFMFLFPVLYAAYKESMLYNGWRHWFFVYVNLAVMAAWGWTWVIENKRVWMRYLGIAIVTIGVGNMTWWMVRSHPNQYIYFNELTGGLKGAYGYYETDYYSNTMREAVEWFVENELPKTNGRHIVIHTNNEPLTAQYYMDKYTDSVDIVWTREYELFKKAGDYSFFTSRTMSKTTLLEGYWPPNGTIHTIKVDDVPLCAIIKHDNNYIAEGYLALDAGNINLSIDLFRKATEYDPGNDEAWRMYGMALANRGPSASDSALAALRKSIEVLPENFIAYDISGMVLSAQGRHDTAATLFEKAISYKINYTNAHYNLGVAYYNMNNFLKAAEEFENCIRFGGQQPLYYKLLGMSKMNMNQLPDAIQFLTFAAQNGNDAEAYQYLGQCYQSQGNEQAAQQMFQQAAQLRGN